MRKAKHKFRVGDWVTVVNVPRNLTDAAKIRTPKIFDDAKGKTFRIEGFDPYGHIELVVSKRHTIWIEPKFLVPANKPNDAA
jgi:hypothetical protein